MQLQFKERRSHQPAGGQRLPPQPHLASLPHLPPLTCWPIAHYLTTGQAARCTHHQSGDCRDHTSGALAPQRHQLPHAPRSWFRVGAGTDGSLYRWQLAVLGTSCQHAVAVAVHLQSAPPPSTTAAGNVPTLTSASIDVCCLANNHVADWGREGLLETLDVLQGAGEGEGTYLPYLADFTLLGAAAAPCQCC